MTPLLCCVSCTGVERGGGDDGDAVDGVVLRDRDDAAGDRRLRARGVVPAGPAAPQRRPDTRRPRLAALLPLSDRATDHRGGSSVRPSVRPDARTGRLKMQDWNYGVTWCR